MRGHSALLLSILIILLAAAALAVSADEPEVLVTFSTNMISGEWQPLTLEPVDPRQLPFNPTAPPGAQYCAEASTLIFPDGGQMTVNGIDEEPIDPILQCAWGAGSGPRGKQGYRTVWYQFTAPDSGYVVIETLPNSDYRQNYDTVVAVYGGNDCGDLSQQLACNDDDNGFLSRAELAVEAGQVYLVEVADWQFGIDTTKVLNIRSSFSVPDSRWEQIDVLTPSRSRHASVLVGQDLYVISGQSVLEGDPVRDPTVVRYNVATGQVTDLAPLRGPDGSGYANTSASHLSGRIYLPSGYVGDEDQYDGTHWVYDIAQNRWNCSDAANTFCNAADPTLPAPRPVPWPGGVPFGWIATAPYPPFGVYYLLGGVTGPAFQLGAVPRGEVFSFQPGATGGVWLTLPPMVVPRYAHTAARLGNKICVAGGVGANQNEEPIVLTNGECYDTVTRVWSLTGSLNVARYNAGSAVGADGRWYLFGGTDGSGASISSVEVYDPATNAWTALDASYAVRNPPRSWPRGGFIGAELWIAGGHLNTANGDQVLGLVDKMLVPGAIGVTNRVLLPSFISSADGVLGDNTFDRALPVGFNILTLGGFRWVDDFFDVFHFDLAQTDSVVVRLESIEQSANYDVLIYDANKLKVGSGQQIANLNEYVPLNNLPPGRYYVMVVRAFGGATLDFYHLIIER